MTTIRQQRVANLLYQELSIIVGGELEDPQLSLVSVTQVDISRDLRNAKVFVSHDNDEVSEQEVLKALGRAMPYIRSQIAMRCDLRVVPEIVFNYDRTPEKAARVDQLIKQIAAERMQREVLEQSSVLPNGEEQPQSGQADLGLVEQGDASHPQSDS